MNLLKTIVSYTSNSLDFTLSTTHALINITEKIRSALDQNKVSCGIFIDLQKTFDTQDIAV